MEIVHGLPEALVPEGGQFAGRGDFVHRLAFQHDLIGVVQVVEEPAIRDAESAIDEAGFYLGLLGEQVHRILIGKTEFPEAAWGMHGGDGERLSLLPVKVQRGIDIDVTHSVSVGEKEVFFFLQNGLDPLDPTTGQGFQAGVHESNFPVLFLEGAMELRFAFAPESEGHIAHHPAEVAEEVFDHFALVAQAENEVSMTMGGIDFHDVPEDGAATDRNHGLGADFCLFAQASPFSSAENDGFHVWRRSAIPPYSGVRPARSSVAEISE